MLYYDKLSLADEFNVKAVWQGHKALWTGRRGLETDI